MCRYALIAVAALAGADVMEAQAPRVAAAVDLRSLSNGMDPSVGVMVQAALVRARNERGSIALGPEVIFHYQGVDRGAPCSTDRTVACERLLESMAGGVGLRAEYRGRLGGLRTYGFVVPGLGLAFRRRDLNFDDCPRPPMAPLRGMPGICMGRGLVEERTLAGSIMMGGGAGVEVDLGKPLMFIESGFRASAGNIKSLWTPIAIGVRW